jgi:YhgE/Pip-like protein
MPHAKSKRKRPTRKAAVKPTRSVRFWAAPILISVAVFSALAALYLGGTLNPNANMHHLPVAIVNEDAGPTGKQVLNGMVSGLDKNKFDVRVLTPQEAQQQLDTARIYAAAGIAPTFSAKLQGVARAAVAHGPVSRPVISVLSNPRAGTMGSNIAGQALNRVAAALDRKIGQRLMQEVAEQTQGGQISPSAVGLLSHPVAIESQVHRPLPDGTGGGLSAFYYALLLLLAGFTGSIVISTLVDSMLGYVPAEFGPVYRFAAQVKISRFRTLLIKWAVTVVVAFLTSAAYLSIAKGFGMPFQNTWVLWLYGVFAIAAVGITSASLIAVLGTVGLLVSLFIFVILGLPSAGATIPLEETPPFYGWLAKFEPMHQVFLGTRALLYFDGRADAGLSQSVIVTAAGLAIGILLGAIVTRMYDQRGYHRIISAEPAGTNEETATTEPTDGAEPAETTEATETGATTAEDTEETAYPTETTANKAQSTKADVPSADY